MMDGFSLQPVLHCAVITAVHHLGTADEASACGAYRSLAGTVRKLLTLQGAVAEASANLNRGNPTLSQKPMTMLWIGLSHQVFFFKECDSAKGPRLETLRWVLLQLLPPLISTLLASEVRVCGAMWLSIHQPVLGLLIYLHTRGMADITSYAGVPLLLLGMLRNFCSLGSDEAFEVAAIATQLVSEAAPRQIWGRHTPLLEEAGACLAMPRAAVAIQALFQQPSGNSTAEWLRQKRQRASTQRRDMSEESITDHQRLRRDVAVMLSLDMVSGLNWII